MIVYAITAEEFADKVTAEIVVPVVALLLILALTFFIIGGIKNLSSIANSGADRAAAFKRTMWMVIGLFVMVSATLIITTIIALVGSEESVGNTITPLSISSEQ